MQLLGKSFFWFFFSIKGNYHAICVVKCNEICCGCYSSCYGQDRMVKNKTKPFFEEYLLIGVEMAALECF